MENYEPQNQNQFQQQAGFGEKNVGQIVDEQKILGAALTFVENKREGNLVDQAKQLGMNLIYKVQTFLNDEQLDYVQEAYFLGEKITFQEQDNLQQFQGGVENQQGGASFLRYFESAEAYRGCKSVGQKIKHIMKEKQKKVMWLTYRKNFNCLLDSGFIDDNGWGCVIRAGQMILAQGLKQHLLGREWEVQNKLDLLGILATFVDDDFKQSCYGYFSIQKIANQGNKTYTIKPGQWYSLNQILFVLETLHKNGPMKQGTQDLAIKIIQTTQTEVSFQEIMECMNLKMCQHPSTQNPRPVFCQICETELKQTQKNQNQVNSNPKTHSEYKNPKSLILFLEAKLGSNHPEEIYLKIVDQLFQMPYSIGMIGGKKERAYYFTGSVGEYYTFLDPHKVQEATNIKNIESLINTYFCNEFFMTKKTEIASSIALGFYIKDGNELQKLWDKLNALSKADNNFWMLLERTKKNKIVKNTKEYYVL